MKPTQNPSNRPKPGEPKLINIPKMRSIFESQDTSIREQFYFDNHLVVLRGSASAFRVMLNQPPPFVVDDRRLGIVMSGEACVNLNLVEKRVKAGQLAFIGPASIITPSSFSPDFRIFGFAIPADFPLPMPLPQSFNGQVRDFQLTVSEADQTIARNILETIWHAVHKPDYHLPTVASLIAAQMNHYDALYRQYADRHQQTLTREQTIFDRFIDLVNQYAITEHQITFYADKMCLTERYLGTVVRQASGITAKEWIDRAIIVRIKAELHHSDKTVARISDEMNFPNPAFFSKYFKRLTGMTPFEYRNT